MRRAALAAALLAALPACSDAPPLVPSVDLIVLPPIGAAAAGSPDTPDFPPPPPELEPVAEPGPEPVLEAASDPVPEAASQPAPESEPEPVPEPDGGPEPEPEPATAAASVVDATPTSSPSEAPPAAPPALLAEPTHRLVAGDGFSYAIPTAWRELDPAALGVPTIVAAQRDTVSIDGFITNVTVAVEPHDGPLLAYTGLHLAAIAEVGALRDAWSSWSGAREAVDVVAVWIQPLGPAYVTLQRYVVDGERGYVVTCAMAATAVEAERPACEALLDGFLLD